MEDLLLTCNNFFYRFKEFGEYSIKNNKIQVRGKYIAGQYIRIIGSFLNDGVFKVKSVIGNEIELENMNDEEFEGYICSLAIPNSFIELNQKIKEYKSKEKNNGIVSESFGNYSYSKATNSSGNPITWQDVFTNELRQYKQMYDGFNRVKEVF